MERVSDHITRRSRLYSALDSLSETSRFWNAYWNGAIGRVAIYRSMTAFPRGRLSAIFLVNNRMACNILTDPFLVALL